MSDNSYEVEEGNEVVRRTIVGGRPLARRKRKMRIPIGIEKVLCRAAGDAGFHKALFDDRQRTLKSLGRDVSEAEFGILGSIPDETLATMIRQIDLRRHSKRKFMRGVVAATFLTAAATAGVSCFVEPGTTGIDPGMEDVVDTMEEEVSVAPDTKGILADDVYEVFMQGIDIERAEPDVVEGPAADVVEVCEPDVVEHQDMMAGTGIIPDH